MYPRRAKPAGSDPFLPCECGMSSPRLFQTWKKAGVAKSLPGFPHAVLSVVLLIDVAASYLLSCTYP